MTKVFEPFFTTKDVGKGSGLGLSQVLGFAKQSGGGVRIETRVGEGTTVRVYLPRATPTGVGQPANPLQPHQGHPKGAVILLLDDDESVREITASLLRELDYVVLSAGSGGAALDLLVSNDGVDLALLDFAMPGMNGMEVARQIQSEDSYAPNIVHYRLCGHCCLKGSGRRQDYQEAICWRRTCCQSVVSSPFQSTFGPEGCALPLLTDA